MPPLPNDHTTARVNLEVGYDPDIEMILLKTDNADYYLFPNQAQALIEGLEDAIKGLEDADNKA